MENRRQKVSKLGICVRMLLIAGLIIVGLLTASNSTVFAKNSDRAEAQGRVDKARITFDEFMRDPNFAWFQENLDRARGILIFPQVLKGGFILGGSGGTGVLLVKNEKTHDWSQPAFYTLGSVTFGLQIGGEAAEVVVLAMSQKAIDSLLKSSFKLGGDASIALGPIGGGAKANADIPSVAADFIAFARSKGLYAGLNLEGAAIAVRDTLNRAYYGRAVSPADIIVSRGVRNNGSAQLRTDVACAAKHSC